MKSGIAMDKRQVQAGTHDTALMTDDYCSTGRGLPRPYTSTETVDYDDGTRPSGGQSDTNSLVIAAAWRPVWEKLLFGDMASEACGRVFP
jgi:hypothetical protein